MTTSTQVRPLELKDIPVRQKRLDLLCQNLYTVKINFSGTSLKKSIIDWESLNFDTESQKALANSKTKISAIPLFEKLEEYARELDKLRREIYSYTIVCEGERVATDNRIGVILEKVAELYDRANQLRVELEASKSEGLGLLLETMRSFYQTPAFKLLPSQIAERLEQVRQIFNSNVQINQLLQVEVHLECRKSLEEQISESAELSEQIARRETAKNAEAEAIALRTIQQQQRESLERFQTEIFEDVREEIAQILAVQIENIAKFDVEKNNALFKKKLATHLERLTTLADFDFNGSFVSAKEGLEQLSQSWKAHRKGCNSEKLKQQLQALKSDLQSKLTAVYQKETPAVDFVQLYYD